MPIYNYKCNECDNKFEILVLSSSEKIECPKCNSNNLEKQFPNRFGYGKNGNCSGGNCSCCNGCH